MDIIQSFDLFLFDLDGLLIKSEELHWLAYIEMCARRGYTLQIDFLDYYRIAQTASDAPQKFIYGQFPALQQEEPNWSVLYEEKKKAYNEILHNNPPPLLDGVALFLQKLAGAKKKMAVVTHTARPFVDFIRSKNPELNLIPNWFCREDYKNGKPAPDGWLKAIGTLAKSGDRIIGFEDSLRGLHSLLAAKVTPVIVNSVDDQVVQKGHSLGCHTAASFHDLLIDNRN